MLRKFKVTIDGKEYLVETEEIDAAGNPVAVTQTPPAAPAQTAPAAVAPEPVKEEPAAPAAGPAKATGDTSGALTAPMPGTVIKILVQPGETVTENQPLLILEAMKMENEVVATQAGTVGEIFVERNQSVNAGDPLIRID